jgi:hypothetical protein
MFIAAVALMSLGMLGCLGSDDSLGAGAQASTGGVILEPNTIRGHARFTNQNPVILDLLDSDPRRYGYAVASSSSPTGYSAQTQFLATASMREFDFELLVESAAGGPAGVAYNVTARRHGSYSFQPVSAHILPPDLQPDPTEVDIAECMGVLRLQWGDDDTCSPTVAVKSADFLGYDERRIDTDYYAYVRGGTSGVSTLRYTVGSDSYTDLITHKTTVQWSVACDEVVTICTPIPETTTELGAVQGPWHVVGEESVLLRRALAHRGPQDNYRYAYSPIEALPSEPDRWWTLPNMVPGSYTLRGRAWLRRGHEHTYYETR